MRVLVAASSKHEATGEIAAEIGRVLSEHGLDVRVASLDAVTDVSGFDAFVLGSAVYVGRWLGPARAFVDEHAGELAARPTWLFSSGPIGDPPKPEADAAVKLDALVEATGAREHHLFTGRLDRSRIGLGERAVVRVVGAADGDYRDWDDVREWAASIADALESAP
jgi:menaquinone-dependent protoporphyrinogen oxidase